MMTCVRPLTPEVETSYIPRLYPRAVLRHLPHSYLQAGDTGRFAVVTLVPSIRFRHPSTAPATRLYGTSSSLKNFVKAISLQKYATTKKTRTRPKQCARFNSSLGELCAMEEPRPENRGAEARSDAATSATPARGEPAAEIVDSTPLFVYGTLMNEQVLSALIGRVPATKEACLSGYHRYRIKDQVYPAIRPKEEGNVRGLYMSGLCPREKLIFDLFEDEDYHKVDVKVEVDGFEAPQTATCYVWNASLEYMLYSTWEPKEHFSDDGAVPGYVRHVKRFAQEIVEEGLLENTD